MRGVALVDGGRGEAVSVGALLSRSETQALLKVSRPTLYRLMRDGLPSLGRGKLRRFDREAVLRWYGAEMPGDDGAEMVAPGAYRCGCGGQVIVRESQRADAVRCGGCGVWDDLEWVGDGTAGG